MKVALSTTEGSEKNQKPRLVAETAEKLRDLILARPADTHLGSLNEVAEVLGVGIVTLQQAARILEHEGLLAVKRGPGGGYYGARPDDAALERAFATYMRVHDFGYREAFEMTLLLDCDIFEAAAGSTNDTLKGAIADLLQLLDQCHTVQDQIGFEINLRERLLTFVKRPFLELLASVAWQLYISSSKEKLNAEHVDIESWKRGRQRILHAICQQDAQLVSFEAQRYRRMMLQWLRREAG
jgi:GntR family transcriptional regulator, transcriptional repressor for pyruvate dehydrogenase complex